jgi:hypothetical protein
LKESEELPKGEIMRQRKRRAREHKARIAVESSSRVIGLPQPATI